MFRHVRSQDAFLDGITIMGVVSVAPATVIKRFGDPLPGDGYKISGEYAFLNDCGDAFVLHDWHDTNLMYDTAPSPAEFWAGEESVELSISSLDLDVTCFAKWLISEHGGGSLVRLTDLIGPLPETPNLALQRTPPAVAVSVESTVARASGSAELGR